MLSWFESQYEKFHYIRLAVNSFYTIIVDISNCSFYNSLYIWCCLLKIKINKQRTQHYLSLHQHHNTHPHHTTLQYTPSPHNITTHTLHHTKLQHTPSPHNITTHTHTTHHNTHPHHTLQHTPFITHYNTHPHHTLQHIPSPHITTHTLTTHYNTHPHHTLQHTPSFTTQHYNTHPHHTTLQHTPSLHINKGFYRCRKHFKNKTGMYM